VGTCNIYLRVPGPHSPEGDARHMTTVDQRETEEKIETQEQSVEEGHDSVSGVEEQPPPRRCRHVTRLIREDGEAYEVTCTCEEGEGTGDGWLDGDGVRWSQKEEHRTRDTPAGDLSSLL
jgi:hypothetical protein